MVEVNVTNYGIALEAATGVTAPGLYADNASLPLGESLGLRQLYDWGLYGFCAYLVEPGHTNQGLCSNRTFGYQWQPMNVLLNGTPDDYDIQTRTLVPNATAFKNSGYLAGLTRPAFWFLFLGTLCAGLCLIAGIIKNKFTFLASSFFSILGTLFLLIGSSIWTSVIGKAQTINTAVVRGGVPLGINVSAGSALWLFWSAFVLLFLSTVPYTISTWAFIKR